MGDIDGFEVVYIDKDSATYEEEVKDAERLYKSSELKNIGRLPGEGQVNWNVLSNSRFDILYMKNDKNMKE